MHSGQFGCLLKLAGKRAELVQMFVPRSRVRIFHNELTRSTPFVPKLMFWCISYHLGASRPFGCLTKLVVKRAELLQKFVPRSRVGIFYNESSRSNPLNPKLMFWCVSYHLGAFETVSLLHETRCKKGQTGAINAQSRV